MVIQKECRRRPRAANGDRHTRCWQRAKRLFISAVVATRDDEGPRRRVRLPAGGFETISNRLDDIHPW
jgi:hypothetical protein